MCPVLTAIAGMTLAASAAGTGLSAYGQYQDTKAANDAADYSAKVAENNATLAGWQADAATKQGAADANRKRIQAEVFQGKQRAAAAASGVQVSSGSPLSLVESTAALGEQDALSVQYAASLEAWGYRNQQKDFAAQAALDRSKKRNPYAGSVGTLLSGAGNLGSMAGGFSRVGLL